MTLEQTQEHERERFYQLAEQLWDGLENRMVPFREVNLAKAEGIGVYYQGAFYADGWKKIDRIDMLNNPLVQTTSAYTSPRTSSQIRNILLTADSRLFIERYKRVLTTCGWFKEKKKITKTTHWATLKQEVPGIHPLCLTDFSPVIPFYEGENELKEIRDMVFKLGNRNYIHRDIREFGSQLDSPWIFDDDKKFPEEGEIVPMIYKEK